MVGTLRRTVLLAGLALLTVAGCAVPAIKAASTTSGEAEAPTVSVADEDCPATPRQTRGNVSGAPAGPFTVGGWGGRPTPWIPGIYSKTVWDSPMPDRLHITLRPHGRNSPAYVLDVLPGPSGTQFPGPGCWDVRIESAGKVGDAVVRLVKAEPGAVFDGGMRDRRQDAVAVGDRADAVARLANFASEQVRTLDRLPFRPHRVLHVRWHAERADPEIGFLSDVIFLPARGAEPALLVIARRFVTGDCSHSGAVAVPASTRVMGFLRARGVDVANLAGRVPNPDVYASDCVKFRPLT